MQDSAKSLAHAQCQRKEALEQLIATSKAQIELIEYRRSQARKHLSVEENRHLQKSIASLSHLDEGRGGWFEAESNLKTLEAAWTESCNQSCLKEKQRESIRSEVNGLKKMGVELAADLKRSTCVVSDTEAELSAAMLTGRNLEQKFLVMSSEVSLCEKRLEAHQGTLDASANFQQQTLTEIQERIEGVYGRFAIFCQLQLVTHTWLAASAMARESIFPALGHTSQLSLRLRAGCRMWLFLLMRSMQWQSTLVSPELPGHTSDTFFDAHSVSDLSLLLVHFSAVSL